MKRLLFVLMCVCFVSMTQAAIVITNGDFQTNAPASNTWNVDSWFDTYPTPDGQTNNWWWEATWYGPTVSPTGTSVMGLSYMFDTTNWAYQSVGTNSEALTELKLQYDVGSFTDAGVARDLGVTVSIYESDGTFVGADEVDVDGAAGITLIDSVSTLYGSVAVGTYLTDIITLDLSTAGSGELFLRFENYAGTVDKPWTAIDNVQIVPEPATLALLGLGGLLLRRKR